MNIILLGTQCFGLYGLKTGRWPLLLANSPLSACFFTCKVYLKAQKVNIMRRKSVSCSVTIQHFCTKSNIKLPARIWQSKEKRTSSYPINSKGYSYMHIAWIVKNECLLHTTLCLQHMYNVLVRILIQSSLIHKYLMYRTFFKFLILQIH